MDGQEKATDAITFFDKKHAKKKTVGKEKYRSFSHFIGKQITEEAWIRLG